MQITDMTYLLYSPPINQTRHTQTPYLYLYFCPCLEGHDQQMEVQVYIVGLIQQLFALEAGSPVPALDSRVPALLLAPLALALPGNMYTQVLRSAHLLLGSCARARSRSLSWVCTRSL